MPTPGRRATPDDAGPDEDEPPPGDARRSLVPAAASRSLWLAAAWTGVAAAVACALIAIVVVAIVWLPAAGEAGSAGSAIRAGILTFLAALRGGITVDGLDAAFLPLGLTVLVGLVTWRAGTGLADAAADLDEQDPRRLARAGALQAGSFALVSAVAAALCTLGSSNAPVFGVFVGGFVVCGLTGGVAFVRETPPLREVVVARIPARAGSAARVALAVLTVYVAAGALLVAVSLVAHHHEVETLSHAVGGGLAGLPVLLLGLLAAPNAAFAGAAYLAGPGFAVGDGNPVRLTTAPHGTLPSFPVLGALPHSAGPWFGWLLAVLTVLAAGVYAAALARRDEQPWTALGLGAAVTAFAGVVLAWQSGGAIGSGRLHAVGASPWQLGLALGLVTGAVGSLALGLQTAGDLVRGRQQDDPDYVPLAGLGESVTESAVGQKVAAVIRRDEPDDRSDGRSDDGSGDRSGDKLAG